MITEIKKTINIRVYPCFNVRQSSDILTPMTKYFNWDLTEGVYLDYPDTTAYFVSPEHLTKSLRLFLESLFEKAIEYYESDGFFVTDFRFEKIHKEAYEWTESKTMEELNSNPANDTGWR